MCFKSTSVTVHTLNFPRMQTESCISLLHFFIFKTNVPLFAFERSSRAKSEHKKFWKRMEGVQGGKERTFFKRFFLSPLPARCRKETLNISVHILYPI